MTPEELTKACEGINRAVMVAVGATPLTIVLLGLSQVAALVAILALAFEFLR